MGDKIFFASKVSKIVTDRIIQKLEQGVVPWRQSWTTSGLPVNWETKRPYGGINLLLLEPGAEYLTFNQIRKLGAHLKKDKTMIVKAAGKAERAVEYILERVGEKQDKQLQQASA